MFVITKYMYHVGSVRLENTVINMIKLTKN